MDNEEIKTRICADCIYSSRSIFDLFKWDRAICTHPRFIDRKGPSMLSGKIEIIKDYVRCYIERNDTDLDACGKKGKFFVPKGSIKDRMQFEVTKKLDGEE